VLLPPDRSGLGFSFDIADTVASQKALNGDHWNDWTSVTCPVRGNRSDELAADHAQDMVARRTGIIRRVELPAGHVAHHDVPNRFAGAVAAFLQVC
jgi:pimeloyl-ACP methyl ester carboxylesterase